MEILATCILSLLSACSYLLPVSFFLPCRLSKKEKWILFLIFLGSILLIQWKLGNIGVVVLLLLGGIYIAWIDENRFLNVSTFIGTYLFCVVCDYLLTLVWEPVSRRIFGSIGTYGASLLYVLLYLLILAAVCPVLSRLLHRLMGKINRTLPRQLTVLISINLVFCLLIFLFNIAVGEYIGYSRPVILFNCFLFGCYFVISTVLIVNIIRSRIENMDLQMKQDAYQRLQEYTGQVEAMYSSLRAFKHDYNNIMLTLSGYMESGDMEGLKAYFNREIAPMNQKLFTATSRLNQLIHIKITELKSIVSAKLLYAAELNINVTVEIEKEISSVPMGTVDLCRVVGIFLDNAIEGALETEKPEIRMAVLDEAEEVVFIISNSFQDTGLPQASLRQAGTTTKGKNRGIGLYNAKEILSAYDRIFWDTEVRNGQFIQCLRMKKQ